MFTESNNPNCPIAEEYIQSLSSFVPFVMCHLHMNNSKGPCSGCETNAIQIKLKKFGMPQELF